MTIMTLWFIGAVIFGVIVGVLARKSYEDQQTARIIKGAGELSKMLLEMPPEMFWNQFKEMAEIAGRILDNMLDTGTLPKKYSHEIYNFRRLIQRIYEEYPTVHLK